MRRVQVEECCLLIRALQAKGEQIFCIEYSIPEKRLFFQSKHTSLDPEECSFYKSAVFFVLLVNSFNFAF